MRIRMWFKNIRRGVILTSLGLLVGASQGLAQFPEDALRLGTPGFGVGARSLGMGNAYTGIASDYSALYWNPAGLSQIEHGEFSAGLSYLTNKDVGTFFDQDLSYTKNATNLNALGLVYPVPVRRGSMVLAFGFSRQAVFNSGLSFNAFNPNSSIIQSDRSIYAPDGAEYPSDLSQNIAYQLYLANIDTVTGKFDSPIRNRVTQVGKVIEGGGLNNWAIGGAVDVTPNVSLGITLTYLSGSYRYDRNYQEQDLAGIYNTHPFDFKSLSLIDFIDGDISGVNAKFGLMYRVPDHLRVGLAVKTPTSFTVKENYGTTARSYFDNGDIMPVDGPFENMGSVEYDVRTPWVFSGGISVIIRELVLSGDVEYTDWTTLEFANANSTILQNNLDIKEIFRPTANFRAGAEYEFRPLGLRLRGGYIYNRSPYEGDPSAYDQQYITGGLGILLGESTMLDVAYAHGWWKTFRVNYDSSSRVDETIGTDTFLLTFAFRF